MRVSSARFHEKPEQFASLAYDAMNALLDSICRAGLNRARIHDALADIAEYDGVTGHMIVRSEPEERGAYVSWNRAQRSDLISSGDYGQVRVRLRKRLRMEGETPVQSKAPYARVGEEGVEYAGPHQGSVPAGALKVVLFGQHADAVAQSAGMQEQLRRASASGVEWTLLPIASDQNWGAASTQLVHALMDEHALAIVALDRDAAHLAEQLALKAFVPVVAISEDRKLTSTNVPWIFRLPAATTPAAAMGLIETAVGKSGANPEKLRDVLASGQSVDGVAFLSTGEPKIQ